MIAATIIIAAVIVAAIVTVIVAAAIIVKHLAVDLENGSGHRSRFFSRGRQVNRILTAVSAAWC
jgi:hypothetical protein